MGSVAFDTLTASKDLQQVGFESKQADAIALVVKGVQGDLATKDDIAMVRSDVEHLRSDMEHLASKEDLAAVKSDLAAVKSDMEHLASKEDLAAVKSELVADLAAVKSDMEHLASKEDLAAVKSDLYWLKWIIGLSLPITIGVMISGFSIIASMLP